MKTNLKLSIISLFIFLGLILNLTSCNKDENESQNTTKKEIHTSGFIQKGPFVSGSQITIQELDNSLNPTGVLYQAVTNDDFGSFSLNSTLKTKYIEVISTGFYFNEVSGSLSEANLTLRALCKVTDITKINVNILTTLSKKRVEYLINNESKTFSEATEQAESEVLSVFNINNSNLVSFNKMDISQPGESNAILLAISVMLQGYNSVAELSELISKISLDMQTDGVLDDKKITQLISNTIDELNLPLIRSFIENRYESLGLSTQIPNFEVYIGHPCGFIADQTIILTNHSVIFTDQSINNPTNWLWDFGDGETSILQNPSHTYSSKGIYTVTLTVSNGTESYTSVKTNFINVTDNKITYNNSSYIIDSGTFYFNEDLEDGVHHSNLMFNTINNQEMHFGDLHHEENSIQGTYNVSDLQENGNVTEIGYFLGTNPIYITQGTLSIIDNSGVYTIEFDGADDEDNNISLFFNGDLNQR